MDMLFNSWSGAEAAAAQQARSQANQAASAAARASSQVNWMQQDVERLFLITEALWNILREEHGYTDEQLLRKVEEIDLRDGRLDGRLVNQEPPKCPQCGRAKSPRRPMCMYCGAAATGDPFKR